MSFKTADVNNEYLKDEKLKKSDITALQEWAKKQSHLPQITELQFILFLQSCYFSIEAAKNAIDTYFMIRAHTPELFNNRDPRSLQDSMEVGFYTILPKRTTDGDTVLFCTLLTNDSSKYVLSDQLTLFDMTTMLWLTQEGTMKGYIVIIDSNLGHMGHLPRISVVLLKKFLYYLQEAMPIRLKAIHIINVAPFVETLVSLVKPIMKKELIHMLHIHSNSIENLYESVPKECLPKEIGGFGDSVATLNEMAKKKLMDNRDFFIQDQLQISDESRRTTLIKNSDELGFVGSFKKLDID